MAKQVDLDKQRNNYLNFLNGKKSVVLATLDEEGNPFTSTSPFVQHNGKFYIYISEVAEHYRYLEKTTLIDVLFITDEANVKNTFATERVRFRCTANNLGNEGNEEVFALFDEKFEPSMMKLLRGLDFSIFELTPIKGRYVVGFGLAFDTSVDGLEFKHVVIDKEKKPGRV